MISTRGGTIVKRTVKENDVFGRLGSSCCFTSPICLKTSISRDPLKFWVGEGHEIRK